jgi:hypothetical protein
VHVQQLVDVVPAPLQRYVPEYRSVVLRALRSDSVGAEVGVWRGDFSRRLLRRVRPRRLYLIDPWAYASDPRYGDALYGRGGAGSQAAMDQVHDQVVRRFAADISAGRVVILRQRSVDAATSLADGELDWVYIDGDHTHDQVLADLEAFLPKVKVGGLVCGDDYGEQGWWDDGVTTAVAELLRRGDVRVEAVHHGQFVLRRLR